MKHLNTPSKLLIVVFLLLIGVYFAVLSPKIQTEFAKRALVELKKEFGADITIDSTRINYFGKIYLYGVKVKDHKNNPLISVGTVEARLSPIAFYYNPSVLELKNIKLIKPIFNINTYKGDTTDSFTLFIDKFSKKDSKNKSKFTLKANVNIIDGKATIHNKNIPLNQQEWLNASHFNGKINNLFIAKDDIRGDIKQIRFDAIRKNKKYTLEDFSARFRMKKSSMYFDELVFHSSNSNLNGNLHFEYKNIKAFKDFNNKVKIDLELKNKSVFGYKDLQYFVENWDTKDKVYLYGKLKGTVSNFTLNNFILDDGKNLLMAKKIALQNIHLLSKGYKVQGQNIKFSSSYTGIKQLLPSYLANKIPKLLENYGEMAYDGDLLLKKGYVYSTGKISSGIGNIELDKFSISNYQDLNKIRYKGNVKTEKLDIEKLTGIKKIGLVDSDLFLDGMGVKKDAVLYAKGNIYEINLFNKNIKNIAVDGNLNNRLFKGEISVDDSNIAANYIGILDFSKEIYTLKFNSNCYNIDLFALGLMKEKANVSAKINGNFSFSNLEDFAGEIKLTEVKFQNKKDKFYFR